MKIVVINNGLAGGGIERASTTMANQFAKWGHEVFVVALYKSKPFFPLETSIKFIEPQKEKRSRLYVLYMMVYIRRQIKKIRPDTILAYNEWTNPYVLFSLQGLHYPVYVTDRMSPLAKCPPITEFLKRIYYNRASGIIAQTEFAKKIIGDKTGAINIKVIPNPVNVIDKIDCEKHDYFVTVGRLTREKGHRYLIEAFAKIKDKSWKLSIVGDGSEREGLESLVNQLGVRDRVIFHGHKINFAEQLSEAKIFVLPSLSEGFPNALIEAMSVPLPCIATRCIPAIDEVAQDGENALLVPKGDSDELANSMERLIADEHLQEHLAKNAYAVREYLCFEKIASDYLKFISDDK